MERRKCAIFLVMCAVGTVVAPPVTQNKSSNDVDSKENDISNDEFGVEYDRYLKEVVQALESDPQFREKLQKAEDTDIRTGKIAHELEFVSHAVRTRLDEVKRTEVERLRKYARKAYELQEGLDTEHLGIQSLPDPEHLDHANPDTFEIEDLKRLIAKATKDLSEADKKRREEFKQYEMQKEFEKHEKEKNMTDADKAKYEAELHEMEEKHKKHAPLHHPISKPQLEEVWEKSDHMENQDFDPKTFFHMHDLDGNRVWDADEVKALFLKELDKIYQAGTPEDDMRERVEEMERMREHVFKEADTNRDGLISYEEFLAQTQKPEFNSDPGWETLDQQQFYTQEEYHKFEQQRQHEIEAMIANGQLPPHAANMHHGGYPPQQQHYQPQQGHPQQFQAPPHHLQGHPQQQFHGQQPQFHGQQQQFHGQQQQFHDQQQQFHGQPQQIQGHPPYQGHQQQFQAQPPQFQQPPSPQQIPNQPHHLESQQGHIAAPQGAPVHLSGQQAVNANNQQPVQPPAQPQFQAQPLGGQQQYQAPHSAQQQQGANNVPVAQPQGGQQQYQAPHSSQLQQGANNLPVAQPQGGQQQYQAPHSAQQQQGANNVPVAQPIQPHHLEHPQSQH